MDEYTCRRGVRTDAMGRLMEGLGWTLEDPGRDYAQGALPRTNKETNKQRKAHRDLPRFGALVGR